MGAGVKVGERQRFCKSIRTKSNNQREKNSNGHKHKIFHKSKTQY